MRRVLFIEGAPAPYRVDFWNEFGKQVDLTVWFQAPHEAGRLWSIEGLGRNFRFEFLPGRRLGEDKYFNAGIIGKLRRERFDACIMSLNCSPTEIAALWWLRRRGVPVIFKSDGGFPHHTANPVKEWIKRRVFPKADAWMSSGSNCTEYLVYYGAMKEGIVEYPFAVSYESDELRPFSDEERAAFRQREGLSGTVILNAGQFIHRKGIDTLLEAYGRIARPDTMLLLIGAGPLEAEYREYIRQQKIPNVVIRPFVQKKELVDYYKTCDIYAFPTRYDIYGLVIIEAMMFGLPVVTTNKAGIAFDTIRDGENGFMVDAENPEQLANALARLVHDSALRAQCGNKARQLVARYTMEGMVRPFIETVEKVIYTNDGKK